MEDFLEFISQVLNVKRDSISLETEYNSIPEWDSLMQLRLVMEIEEKYSIEIDIDEVQNLKNLNDFYKLVREK